MWWYIWFLYSDIESFRSPWIFPKLDVTGQRLRGLSDKDIADLNDKRLITPYRDDVLNRMVAEEPGDRAAKERKRSHLRAHNSAVGPYRY